VRHLCFPEDTSEAVLFRETILKSYRNLIEIVKAILEKISILYSGAFVKGPYGMFILTRYRPMMDKLAGTA
jgi:hypothetical protein